VNAHDPLEQRVDYPRGPQLTALYVVDGVFPAQDEQEEELREAAAERDDPPAAEPVDRRQAGRSPGPEGQVRSKRQQC
jgi:hypothetical protein